MRRLREFGLLAAAMLVAGCGTFIGSGYEVDYFDAGPVEPWTWFYHPPWYRDDGWYYAPPPHWDPAGAAPGPHIPDRPRPRLSGGKPVRQHLLR